MQTGCFLHALRLQGWINGGRTGAEQVRRRWPWRVECFQPFSRMCRQFRAEPRPALSRPARNDLDRYVLSCVLHPLAQRIKPCGVPLERDVMAVAGIQDLGQ
ncbi:hypothetical protein MSKU9_0442 [Komagataeibacter diospyri]|uniref:Uncharacterized protein n=1 Tax=Komagataeibacter diospyri TaxID=1932662 RepID=A0A4P5NR94_9PROT|nr:hypothetical protein MSKU9_0442 [Komagataeibacter diospyri]